MLHNLSPVEEKKPKEDLSRKSELKIEEFTKQLSELELKKQAIPLQLRFKIFKNLLASEAKETEKVRSPFVRMMFDYDLQFALNMLPSWQKKKELAQQGIKNIKLFFEKIDLPKEMSFFEHSYYCFCISALISGISIENLANEYDKSLKTMVYGVVHPEEKLGKWSIKGELENQTTSKYISHVSKTGFATIEEINQMTTFRLAKDTPFNGIRILAIACNEEVEFDGVTEMEVDKVNREVRSLEVLKHDFIHAAFLRRDYEKEPQGFSMRFDKLGKIYEDISEDKKLEENIELKKLVNAAWFFWLHEFTTSIYVDGIPTSLPKPHKRAHGKYANEPQLLLRGAAKINIFPSLFKNEVDVELRIFKSLKIPLKALEKESKMNDHNKVKEMMDTLHHGYEYLDKHFSAKYDLKNAPHWSSNLFKREKAIAQQRLSTAFKNLSGSAS